MLRKFLMGLGLTGLLFITGCNCCGKTCCGSPLFAKSRQCCQPACPTPCPQPCNNCGPSAVPAVPNGAVVVPPNTSGFGPTPNIVVPPSSPAGF
jgi:hypothetical protein